MLFSSFRFPFPVSSVLGFRHLGQLPSNFFFFFFFCKNPRSESHFALTVLSSVLLPKFGIYHKQNMGPSRRMTHLSHFFCRLTPTPLPLYSLLGQINATFSKTLHVSSDDTPVSHGCVLLRCPSASFLPSYFVII